MAKGKGRLSEGLGVNVGFERRVKNGGLESWFGYEGLFLSESERESENERQRK